MNSFISIEQSIECFSIRYALYIQNFGHFSNKIFWIKQNNMNTAYHQQVPKTIMNNEYEPIFMNTA